MNENESESAMEFEAGPYLCVDGNGGISVQDGSHPPVEHFGDSLLVGPEEGPRVYIACRQVLGVATQANPAFRARYRFVLQTGVSLEVIYAEDLRAFFHVEEMVLPFIQRIAEIDLTCEALVTDDEETRGDNEPTH